MYSSTYIYCILKMYEFFISTCEKGKKINGKKISIVQFSFNTILLLRYESLKEMIGKLLKENVHNKSRQTYKA